MRGEVRPDGVHWKDEEWLREQYWEEGKTIREIAEHTPVTPASVRNRMIKCGIERRDWRGNGHDG